MALDNIPLDMFGVVVGTAKINDDGTIEIHMDGPCQFGIDTLAQIEAGDYQQLTIQPRGSMFVPFPPPSS